jgi:hypothetical protein
LDASRPSIEIISHDVVAESNYVRGYFSHGKVMYFSVNSERNIVFIGNEDFSRYDSDLDNSLDDSELNRFLNDKR